ncbi:MAG: ABC transporter permease [Cyclobacteriaceae bacterium]
MRSSPPKLLKKLLSKFCNPTLWESIEGDLHELFLSDVERHSIRKAKLNYFLNAVAFLRYHRLRKTHNSKTLNNMALIKNYLKVSFRDLKRNKTFTGINLTGLIAGMTVSLLMLQYVLFETGFDRFHKDSDRIYRVINDRYQNGELIQHGTITYPVIGPTLKKDFPEIEAFTRLTYSGRAYLEFDNQLFLTNQFLIADEHFPSFFSFEMLEGVKATCLDDAYTIVLTKSYAEKLYSNDQDLNALIGKFIEFNGNPLKITGIMADPPTDSHLQFELLISYKTFIERAGDGADNSWEWSDFYHYVRLKEGIDVASLDEKMADFGVRYFKQGEVSGGEEKFFLQPLSEAHLNNTMEYEIGQVTNGKIVWLMLSIAIFIIIIAWINYINLNTSRAIQRAKEVGIRKSIGALRGQVINQFLVETLTLNMIALIISLWLTWILQPSFNQLTGLDLSMLVLWNASVGQIPFPLFFAFVLLVSLFLVAIYPALLVTRFGTQDILKGSFKLKGEIVWLRKGLVIFQFCIAVVLITASITISRQIDFMLNQDLGVDIKNTMVIYGPSQSQWDSTFISKTDRLKNEISSLAGVHLVTWSSRVIGERMGRIFQIKSSADPEAANLTSNFFNTDHTFSELYGMQLMAGRDFLPEDHNFDGDLVKNIVINQSAVKLLKFKDERDAVGKTVYFWNKNWTIIGIVKDFHQRSLHSKIEPVVLIPYFDTSHHISIKLTSEPSESLVSSIEKKFKNVFPGNYFDYFFLEDQYLANYSDEMRMGKISTIFTFLSILIATLGLYGLIAITVIRKTKEIGMRKVLGASTGQLLGLLSKEFLLLVFLASLIGAPLSYFALSEWKAGFAYSEEISIGIVALSSIALVFVSMLTIVLQTQKISGNNPIKSLRYE